MALLSTVENLKGKVELHLWRTQGSLREASQETFLKGKQSRPLSPVLFHFVFFTNYVYFQVHVYYEILSEVLLVICLLFFQMSFINFPGFRIFQKLNTEFSRIESRETRFS